jgi:hypothetical protein
MKNLNVQQKVFLQMKNAKNRKLKMKDIQIFVFIAQGKKVHTDTNTQGYYCTNFKTWLSKYKYITKDENRCYKLTALGKLYITNPSKAIDIYQKRYYKALFERYYKALRDNRREQNYKHHVNTLTIQLNRVTSERDELQRKVGAVKNKIHYLYGELLID